MRIYLEFDIRRIDCGSCPGVKQEKLDWLADNPFYTKRFAFYLAYPVGCQSDASVIMDEDGSPRLSDDASRVSAGFPG